MAITKSLTASAASATDASSYTFSSQAFGTAASDRYILVAVAARSSATRTLNSVTIGGVSGTSLVNFASGNSHAAFFIAAVPTGTTGDVVVTFSSTMLRCVIGVWRLDGLDSTTPADSDSNAVEPATANITIPADGAAFGVSFVAATTDLTVSWTNLTLDQSYLTTASWESNGRATFASETYATLQTELALTADWSASGNPACAFVSFTPTAGGGGGAKPWHYYAQMRQMGA